MPADRQMNTRTERTTSRLGMLERSPPVDKLSSLAVSSSSVSDSKSYGNRTRNLSAILYFGRTSDGDEPERNGWRAAIQSTLYDAPGRTLPPMAPAFPLSERVPSTFAARLLDRTCPKGKLSAELRRQACQSSTKPPYHKSSMQMQSILFKKP